MKSKDNFDRICAYCENACALFDPDTMLCSKKGVVSKAYHCKAFIYDPLKRIPPKTNNAPKLEFIDID